MVPSSSDWPASYDGAAPRNPAEVGQLNWNRGRSPSAGAGPRWTASLGTGARAITSMRCWVEAAGPAVGGRPPDHSPTSGTGPSACGHSAAGPRRVLYGVLVRAEREAVTVEVEGRRYRYATSGRDLARGLRSGARIRLEVEADADGRPVAVTRVF